MAVTDDYELLYKVSKMYYYDKMNQVEISAKTGLSRPTISRVLEAARVCGMVNVTLRMPTETIKYQNIEKRLKEALKIRRVIVVPVDYDDETPESLDALSHEVTIAAAEHMPELLADSECIGIGWGRSVYNTSLHLRHIRDGKSRFFVQLVNNFPAGSAYLQPSVIIGRFAEAFGASGYSYFFNGVLGAEEDKVNLKQLQKYWDHMDSAVISIARSGNLTKGYSYGYATDLWRANPMPTDIDLTGTAFEGLGQIYSDRGECLTANKTFDMVAFELKRLKEVKNVICIAAGKKKSTAVINAGRLGFFSTLIIDSITAEDILDRLHK